MTTDLNIQVMALSDLEPAPYNPRTISATALAGLRNSVERFGLVEPIVWNRRTGRVVGGHQRLKVLQGMGETETQVVVVDLDETEEKALNVALNNPAIAGEFTADIHRLLAEINAAMPELADLLRFDDLAEQTRALLADLTPNEGATDPDEVPEAPETPITQPGDLWVLGRHRLVCGDSGDPAVLELLMDGQKAAAVRHRSALRRRLRRHQPSAEPRDKDRGREPGSQNRDWSDDYLGPLQVDRRVRGVPGADLPERQARTSPRTPPGTAGTRRPPQPASCGPGRSPASATTRRSPGSSRPSSWASPCGTTGPNPA